MRDIDHDTRAAAAGAFLNVINNANQEQTKYMVSLGCIQHICDLLLISTEKGEVFRCLLGLGRILQVSRTQKNQETKGYGQMIVQANGIDIIKKLNHQNMKITTLAGKILKKLSACPTSNRKAILIALREKLPYIQKEIPTMEKLLINKFRFQGESILTMTDYGNYKVATKKAIQNAVKDAAQEMPPADNLFLFITGHGGMHNKKYAIWPTMGIITKRGGNHRLGIMMKLVINMTREFWTNFIKMTQPTMRVTVFMDCCHAGVFFKEARLESETRGHVVFFGACEEDQTTRTGE
ncbi:Importin subunit alpha-5 [Orobanche gracilis]